MIIFSAVAAPGMAGNGESASCSACGARNYAFGGELPGVVMMTRLTVGTAWMAQSITLCDTCSRSIAVGLDRARTVSPQ
jgi:hypothetical protein